MKFLFPKMIERMRDRIKADAPKNKSRVAKNKTDTIKKSQPAKEVLEEKSVMKESKTLMID